MLSFLLKPFNNNSKFLYSLLVFFATISQLPGFGQIPDTVYTDTTFIIQEIDKNGLRHGSYAMYDDEDRYDLFEKGKYEDGAKTGNWEYRWYADWLIEGEDEGLYDPQGVRLLVSYKNGKREGKAKIELGNPHFSGYNNKFYTFAILAEGAYTDNKMDGVWRLYHYNSDKKKGELAAEVTFEKGEKLEANVYTSLINPLRIIPFPTFLDNVEVREENVDGSYAIGYYKSGLKSGNWKYYNKDNKRIQEVDFNLQGEPIEKSVNTEIVLKERSQALRIVYPHPDLIMPNKVNYSENNKYVVVSKDDGIYAHITYAVYNTKTRVLVNSDKLEMPKDDLGVEGITNDGRYLQIFDYKDQMPLAIYDVLADTLLFEHENDKLFDYSNVRNYGEYISGNYILNERDKEIEVTDKRTGKSYVLDSIYNQKPYFWEDMQLSPNGRYIGILNKSVITIWDTRTNELIWESPKQQTFFYEPEFRMLENNIILCNKVEDGQKNLQLYWFDYLNREVIYSSNEQMFASLGAIGQLGNYVYLGLGDGENKKTENLAVVDLATGQSVIAKNDNYKSGQFYKFQKVFRDSLAKQQPEYIAHLNSTAQSAYKWTFFADDYFDADGNPHADKDSSQLSYDFFMEHNYQEYLKDDFDVDELKQYEIVYAYDNRATYFDKSDDFIFGLMSHIDVKKQLLFWNGNMPEDKRNVIMLFAQNGQPFFYSDDLYYFGSPDHGSFIKFSIDGKVFNYEQFDLKYNRPDIILERLGWADENLIKAYNKAYQKRLKKMGFSEEMLQDDFHIPELFIENYEDLPTITDADSITIGLKMKDSRYPLDRLNVWVNDVAVYGTNGISLKEDNASALNREISIRLVKGTNKIDISVLNQAGAESYKESIEIISNAGKSKPDLYLIAIGAGKFENEDYDLNFASKDARDIAALFSNSPVFANVYSKVLTNADVTVSAIKELSNFLKKADINDEVLVFVAGHGVLDQELDYYFATYDMDFLNPALQGLAYNELEAVLDGITPLKKMLWIDACHSGEIDKEEVMLATNRKISKDGIKFRAVGSSVAPKLGVGKTSELTKKLFADLRKGTGATVISSAGGMEYAMEGDQWHNGLFTYCIVSGIKTMAADLNQDGEIWLSELKKYVSEKVPELSEGNQKPTSRIENQVIDYRVW